MYIPFSNISKRNEMKDTCDFIPVAICFAVCMLSVVQAKSIEGMLSDQETNKIDKTYPIDLCPTPPRHQKINAKKIKQLLPQFIVKLQNTADTAKKAKKFVMTECDIAEKDYRKYALKDLNPKASKRTNRQLGILKNRKAKQLMETSWWLTSMLKAAHEISQMEKLKSSRLIDDLEKISYYLLDILMDMKIRVPSKANICYRNQSIEFPLEERDIEAECDYAFLAIRDIHQGLNHLSKVLSNCKISVRKGKKRGNGGTRKNRRTTEAKLRCKKSKTVFYPKCRKGNRTGCLRRKMKFTSWEKQIGL